MSGGQNPREMRIAISGNEGFIAPYLFSLLDGIAEEVPEEALSDSPHLDAALASAQVLIHFHGHPPGGLMMALSESSIREAAMNGTG